MKPENVRKPQFIIKIKKAKIPELDRIARLHAKNKSNFVLMAVRYYIAQYSDITKPKTDPES